MYIFIVLSSNRRDDGNPDVNYYANKLEEKSTEEELLNSLSILLSVPFVFHLCVCCNFDITLLTYFENFITINYARFQCIEALKYDKCRIITDCFCSSSNMRLVSSFRLFCVHFLKLFSLKINTYYSLWCSLDFFIFLIEIYLYFNKI